MPRWAQGALGLPLLCGAAPSPGWGQWHQAAPWALLGSTRVAVGVGTVRLVTL